MNGRPDNQRPMPTGTPSNRTLNSSRSSRRTSETVYGAYHVSRITYHVLRITYEARDLVFRRLVEMKLAVFPNLPQVACVPRTSRRTSHVRGTPWGGQPKWNPCRGGGLIFSHWQNTHTHLPLIIIRIDHLLGQERRVDRVGQRISHSGEAHFSSSMGNNNVNNTKSRLARSAHVAVLPVVACLSLFFGQATARNAVDTCVDWLIG